MKKITSLLMAVLMLITVIPFTAIPAFAADTVTEYYALDVGAGAYINTGYKPTSETHVVMKAEVKTNDTALFGVNYVVNNTNYNFYVIGSNGGYYGSGFGTEGDFHYAYIEPKCQTIELDKNLFKLDGEVKHTYSDVDFNHPEHTNHPIYLFALFHPDSNNYAQTFENQFIRFYSCKIYEGNELKHEFVPAKLGNNFGVCDKKDNNKFYANQGDGYMVGYKKVNAGGTLPSGNEGVILDFDGEITVSENTTINALPGQSGIVIAGGRNVIINIKEGKTLTVNGGAAIGRYGAGAGIEVPTSSSITVCGFGTLNATGGAAAVGENGRNGGNGYIAYWSRDGEDNCYSASGGYGGYGGGGAGAGIGGRGGYGGLGGAGGAGLVLYPSTSTVDVNGNAGENGKDGTAGENCGIVKICDTINNVFTKGGTANDTASSGGNHGIDGHEYWSNLYIAGGGGGGGAGGNGYKGANIGSGGGGAGGGAGGGSGYVIWKWNINAYEDCNGTGFGGGGGSGSSINGKGNDGASPQLSADVISANAGYSGGAGGAGGNGAGAGVEIENPYYYEPVAVPQVNVLIYNGEEQNGFINLDGLDKYYTLSGTVSAKNVGAYTATFTLKDGYIWSDGKLENKVITWYIEKQTISVSSKISLHYTGYPVSVVPDNSPLYTADYEGGKKTAVGNGYSVKLKLNDTANYMWEDQSIYDKEIIYDIHEYKDEDFDGECDGCVGTNLYLYDIHYLEKEVSTDYTVVNPKISTCVAAQVISKDDTVWGDETTTEKVWYVVDKSVTLTDRPTVKGNVGIILTNGRELVAKKGITVEEGNTLSIYAQTDNESKMGKLTADTGDVTAIGGKNGGNGRNGFNYMDGDNGGNGGNCGTIKIFGGNVSLKTSGVPCIGGGNGGTAGNGCDGNKESTSASHGGNGGNGGNCGVIYFCGGNILLESSNAVCIGGGHGGNGGKGGCRERTFRGSYPGNGGSGGKGGNGGSVYFIAGSILLKNTNAYCIGGGNGGKGGNGENGYKFNSAPNGVGGNGGNGGDCGSVYFCGGDAFLKSERTACIGGGIYGSGGDGGHGVDLSSIRGNDGQPGAFTPENDLNVSGKPGIKAGNTEQDAGEIDFTEYNNQPFLSVHYHTWEQYDSSSHKCSVCGEIAKHTDDGTGVCTVCGGTVVITVPGKAATCTKAGYHAYYRCGTKYYKDQKCTQEITDIDNWLKTEGRIEASGHSGEWKVTTAPSCTQKGSESLICKVCGETLDTKTVKATGHTPFDEWTVLSAATCTKNGSESLKCKVCGETLETRTVKATGHTPFDEWTVLSAATCTNDGFEVLKCKVCGEQLDTRVIPATGHTYSEDWSSDETHHWHEAACGHDSIADKAEHTPNENGICSVCGYDCKTNASVDNQQGNDGNEQQDNEPTGLGSVLSDGNWWIIIAVAILAIAGVVALFIVKKKKVKNNS